MGIILLIIGFIVLRALYHSGKSPLDKDFNMDKHIKNTNMLMLNPLIRLILTAIGWVLVISGIVNILS